MSEVSYNSRQHGQIKISCNQIEIRAYTARYETTVDFNVPGHLTLHSQSPQHPRNHKKNLHFFKPNPSPHRHLHSLLHSYPSPVISQFQSWFFYTLFPSLSFSLTDASSSSYIPHIQLYDNVFFSYMCSSFLFSSYVTVTIFVAVAGEI
jgi:hypothetical protein